MIVCFLSEPLPGAQEVINHIPWPCQERLLGEVRIAWQLLLKHCIKHTACPLLGCESNQALMA